jgi:hypothetical protein
LKKRGEGRFKKWLEAQVEFFHKVMPKKAKRIRERSGKG